jgi:hypothetical protein
VREHERWAASLGDDLRHRHRFARTGDAAQRLRLHPFAEATAECRGGPGLVPGKIPGQYELERRASAGSVYGYLKDFALGHGRLILERMFGDGLSSPDSPNCRAPANHLPRFSHQSAIAVPRTAP